MPEQLRDATLWEGLPASGLTHNGLKAENGTTMLSKVGARRIRDLYNPDIKAGAPAPLAPVAPGTDGKAPQMQGSRSKQRRRSGMRTGGLNILEEDLPEPCCNIADINIERIGTSEHIELKQTWTPLIAR